MHANIAPRVRPLMDCWMMSSDQCMRALIAAIAEAGAVVHWMRPTRFLFAREFAKRSRVLAKARTFELGGLRSSLEPPKALIECGPFVKRDFPPKRERAQSSPSPRQYPTSGPLQLVLAADGRVCLDH